MFTKSHPSTKSLAQRIPGRQFLLFLPLHLLLLLFCLSDGWMDIVSRTTQQQHQKLLLLLVCRHGHPKLTCTHLYLLLLMDALAAPRDRTHSLLFRLRKIYRFISIVMLSRLSSLSDFMTTEHPDLFVRCWLAIFEWTRRSVFGCDREVEARGGDDLFQDAPLK